MANEPQGAMDPSTDAELPALGTVSPLPIAVPSTPTSPPSAQICPTTPTVTQPNALPWNSGSPSCPKGDGSCPDTDEYFLPCPSSGCTNESVSTQSGGNTGFNAFSSSSSAGGPGNGGMPGGGGPSGNGGGNGGADPFSVAFDAADPMVQSGWSGFAAGVSTPPASVVAPTAPPVAPGANFPSAAPPMSSCTGAATCNDPSFSIAAFQSPAARKGSDPTAAAPIMPLAPARPGNTDLSIVFQNQPGGSSCQNCQPTPSVNPAQGNLVVPVQLPSTGPADVGVQLTYSSRDNGAGEFGHGWTSNLRRAVVLIDSSTAQVVTDDGTIWQYGSRNVTTGVYTPPAGAKNKLQRDPGTSEWIETQPDGSLYRYDSSTGKLKYLANYFGRRWTIIRDGGGRVKAVQNPGNQRTTLVYDGSNNLKRVQDYANRLTTFTVDGSGNLTQMVSCDLCVTAFRYDGSHRLTSWITPKARGRPTPGTAPAR